MALKHTWREIFYRLYSNQRKEDADSQDVYGAHSYSQTFTEMFAKTFLKDRWPIQEVEYKALEKKLFVSTVLVIGLILLRCFSPRLPLSKNLPFFLASS